MTTPLLDLPARRRDLDVERPRIRVLLVEDEPADARLIREMLADAPSLDVAVEWRPSLLEALSDMDDVHPDAVLLDLGLGDSGGLDTVESMVRVAGEIPVVVLTGLGDGEAGVPALEAGADEYLTKDEVTPEAVSRALRYALGRREAARALRRERDLSQGILSSLEDHIAVLGRDGRIVEVNDAWRAFALAEGGEEDAYLDADYLDVTARAAGEDAQARAALEGIRAVLEGDRNRFDLEYPCHSPEARRWFRLVATPLRGPGGEGAVVSHTDVTERVAAEREVRQSREKYSTLFELSPSVVAVTEMEDGTFVEVNQGVLELTGYTRPEIVGRSATELGVWDDVDQREAVVDAVRRQGEVRGVELDFRRKDGERRHVLASCRLLELEGRPLLLWAAQDITERRETEAALRESERQYRALFEESLDPISLVSPEGRILDANPAWMELLGCGPEDLDDLTVQDLVPDDADVERLWRTLAESGGVTDYEVAFRTLDGRERVCRLTVTPYRNGGDDVKHYLNIVRDVTERKAMEDRIRHQALHDWLTDVPNRQLFRDRVDHALQRVRREGGGVALAMLDLDRFKRVNDSLGHTVGDRVLREVAGRLQAVLRESDTVARVGGDEFGLLLEDVECRGDVESILGRVRAAIRDPVEVGGDSFRITPSIGVVVHGSRGACPDCTTVDLPEDLTRFADLAMHRAKEAGGGAIHYFSSAEDMDRAGLLRREQELRRAIEADQFEVHYQPVVSLAEGRIVGLEPLARWEHPERGTVSPGEFIPLAEETGMIRPLGAKLFRKACRDLRGWRRRWPERPLFLTVNLSGRQMEDDDLTGLLARIMREEGVEPADVQFEITETAIMRGTRQVDRLKELGVKVAVDDFGTGYSSFTYLKHLTVDTLKIDMSFVQGLDRDLRDTAIVETILTLGSTLDLTVVAEGIETEGQLRRLRALGCRQGQGFRFARPAAAGATTALLEEDPDWSAA